MSTNQKNANNLSAYINDILQDRIQHIINFLKITVFKGFYIKNIVWNNQNLKMEIKILLLIKNKLLN